MLDEKDKTLIFKLAHDLTGGTQTGDVRQGSLVHNVERRMRELGFATLVDYLNYVNETAPEMAHLVSALTIHTTSWFRENPHFVIFQEILLEALEKREVFKMWCAACSTGEEVYSFALMLEEFRRVHPEFDYRIYGSDIDPVSIAVAERAVYALRGLNFHVGRYRQHWLEGSGKSEGLFTLSKDIRERCRFHVHDLRSPALQAEGPFHLCVCRNVLIYFDNETVGKVVGNLVNNVKAGGQLMLGHSESIAAEEFGLTAVGHSVFTKASADRQENERSSLHRSRYKILCIDDSLTTQKFLSLTLTELGFESVTVGSASEATSFLNFNNVDLITLDLKMPGMSGERWLRAEREEGLKTPIVILSEAHAADAAEVVKLLAMGAQHYIEKSTLQTNPRKLKEIFIEMIQTHAIKPEEVRKKKRALPSRRPAMVLIGASTGGPQALSRLLQKLPAECPPILITQHISTKFARPLAERLAEGAGLPLGSLENGSTLMPGHLYMAEGDYHLGVTEQNGRLVVQTSNSAPFNGHRPSVDFLFNSAVGLDHEVMAILLTGMGRDGALGMRFLQKENAFCIAQSEEDCVVFGMPREAIERDAVDFVGNIDEIRRLMLDSFNLKIRKAG